MCLLRWIGAAGRHWRLPSRSRWKHGSTCHWMLWRLARKRCCPAATSVLASTPTAAWLHGGVTRFTRAATHTTRRHLRLWRGGTLRRALGSRRVLARRPWQAGSGFKSAPGACVALCARSVLPHFARTLLTSSGEAGCLQVRWRNTLGLREPGCRWIGGLARPQGCPRCSDDHRWRPCERASCADSAAQRAWLTAARGRIPRRALVHRLHVWRAAVGVGDGRWLAGHEAGRSGRCPVPSVAVWILASYRRPGTDGGCVRLRPPCRGAVHSSGRCPQKRCGPTGRLRGAGHRVWPCSRRS